MKRRLWGDDKRCPVGANDDLYESMSVNATSMNAMNMNAMSMNRLALDCSNSKIMAIIKEFSSSVKII